MPAANTALQARIVLIFLISLALRPSYIYIYVYTTVDAACSSSSSISTKQREAPVEFEKRAVKKVKIENADRIGSAASDCSVYREYIAPAVRTETLNGLSWPDAVFMGSIINFPRERASEREKRLPSRFLK